MVPQEQLPGIQQPPVVPPQVRLPGQVRGHGGQQAFPGVQGPSFQQVPSKKSGGPSGNGEVSCSNLESLYNITIKNPQYRALDFIKLSSFSYSKKVDHKNINLSSFAFGSIKHLLALSDGTLPPVSKVEFNSRLQHLANIFEIVCINSTLNDFKHESWSEGNEYCERVLSDIEHNVKSWETLSRSIDSTCWQFAKSFADQFDTPELY